MRSGGFTPEHNQNFRSNEQDPTQKVSYTAKTHTTGGREGSASLVRETGELLKGQSLQLRKQ